MWTHLATKRLAPHPDCTTELAAFNKDGKFLIVGDRLGTVHFIHVESRSVVFSQALLPLDDLQEDGPQVFKHMHFDSPQEYLL